MKRETDSFRKRSVRPAVLAAVVAVVVAVARTAVPVEYLAGILVVPTVVFGPVVATGAALGVAASSLLRGSFGAWTVIDAVWTFGLPYCTYALWSHRGGVRRNARSTARSPRRVGEYLVSLGVATVCTLAVVAWATPVLGAAPFFPSHVALVTGAAVGGVVGAVTLPVLDRAGWLTSVEPADGAAVEGGRSGDTGRITTAALFGTCVCWYVLGTGIAAVTHDIRLFDNAAAVKSYAAGLVGTNTLGTVVAETLAFLYRYGDLTVAALGAAALCVILWLWPTPPSPVFATLRANA